MTIYYKLDSDPDCSESRDFHSDSPSVSVALDQLDAAVGSGFYVIAIQGGT